MDGWNQEDRLRHALMPLKGLGAGHDPLREKMHPRMALIDKASRFIRPANKKNRPEVESGEYETAERDFLDLRSAIPL